MSAATMPPLTPQDLILIWEDGFAGYVNPQGYIWYFLRVEDLLEARQHGPHDPLNVNTAYLQGDSADTETVKLVITTPTGDRFQGNVAYFTAISGKQPARFAPTAEAASAYQKNGNNAVGMLDIPLVKFHKPAFRPLPEITTAYAEESTSNLTNPQDRTSFLASQAHWTRANPPAVTAIIEPLRAVKTDVPMMRDGNGRQIDGPIGKPLRALGHVLPRRISTEITEDSWRLAAWFLAEPRLIAQDVVDWMYRAMSPQDQKKKMNEIRQQAARWRIANHTMAPTERASSSGNLSDFDTKPVQGLTTWQLEHNTSWEPNTQNQFIKLPGPTNDNNIQWYALPYLHPTSPYMICETSDGFCSPRVRKALGALQTAE